jgi:hypothetical protein
MRAVTGAVRGMAGHCASLWATRYRVGSWQEASLPAQLKRGSFWNASSYRANSCKKAKERAITSVKIGFADYNDRLLFLLFSGLIYRRAALLRVFVVSLTRLAVTSNARINGFCCCFAHIIATRERFSSLAATP